MESLRDWYFDKQGGLFMSTKTQQVYLGFQSALFDSLASAKDNEPLSLLSYEKARKAGSALRTSMTEDLHSRKGFWGF